MLDTITSVGRLAIAGGETSADLAAAIQPAVDALVKQGVNKIVVLAHMQQIAIERELAELLSGVDIIVAGGSNTLLADADDELWPGDSAAIRTCTSTEAARRCEPKKRTWAT